MDGWNHTWVLWKSKGLLTAEESPFQPLYCLVFKIAVKANMNWACLPLSSLALQQSLSVVFSRGEAGVERIVNLVKSTYLSCCHGVDWSISDLQNQPIVTEEKSRKFRKKQHGKRRSQGEVTKEREDECFSCGDAGQLVSCKKPGCPKVYHADCLNLTKRPAGWCQSPFGALLVLCPSCQDLMPLVSVWQRTLLLGTSPLWDLVRVLWW